MKKYLAVVFLSVCCIAVSCKKESIKGGGSVITESRQVADFSKISVSGSTNIFISQGASFDVKVKAYENIVPYLETKVQNGTLLIAFKANSNVSNDNSEVFITMPALNGVAVSGSGNINSTGKFPGSDDFTASISGSGNIILEEGATTNYQINISGSGSVKSFDMVSQQAVATIAGSGNAELSVLKDYF